MSQKMKTPKNVLAEPTTKTEAIGEEISCKHASEGETQETCSGTRRVSILFREITKQLRNQLLDGATRQEQVSEQVQFVSETAEDSDMPRKMSYVEEGCIKPDPISFLQDCKVWDKEKKRYNDHLNTSTILDKGLISKSREGNIHDILRHLHGGMYNKSVVYLDVNTAGNNVVVRNDLKSAFWTVEDQCYPKSRKRFKDPQVLSTNSFDSGQYYWVVETSRSGNWRIGMCYPSIARKGFRSYIGCSKKSWGLCKWNNQYSMMHNCKEVPLSPSVSSQRLAIFLDYNRSQLSFYELSSPVRLLHTFTATFTEPLHAVFRIWLDSLGSSWILIRD